MENPKLALIPSGYKVGKVYSILPVDGICDFYYERFATASRVKEDGLIDFNGYRIPRLDWTNRDCPSLLLEPQRTNFLTYSEDLTQWTRTNIEPITPNSIISPDGIKSGSEVLESFNYGSPSIHYAYNGVISVSTSTSYTYSIFVKKLGRKYVGIQTLFNTVKGAVDLFDLDNGSLAYEFSQGGHTIQNANIENYANGWYRISATFQVNDSTAVFGLVPADQLWSSGTAYNNLYVGDNTKGVYAFGGQVEQGDDVTSYIKTQGYISTRDKDRQVSTIFNADLEFNSDEGVAFIDVKPLVVDDNNSFGNVISLRGGLYDVIYFRFSIGNVLKFYVNNAPSTPIVSDFPFQHNNGRIKAAISWTNGSYFIYANGVKLNSYYNTNRELSFLNVFGFESSNNQNGFEGEVYQAQVFEKYLTDAQIIKLTEI